MRLGTYPKTTVDNIRFEIDYSEWLVAPEVLTDYEFGSDPTGLLITTVSIVDGTSLVFFLGGGMDGEAHNLLVTITTSGGQVRQDFIVVTVADP